MAALPEYQITNIHPPAQEHERITHCWVPVFNRWVPVDEAISLVQGKTCQFYVLGRYGEKAYAGVFQATGKHPCLRTHADGKWNDNLKALPGVTRAA